MSRQLGKLYLIGAGPGDPGLLTLKGARALADSDVILYDRLVAKESLQHAKPGAQLIYVGKHHGRQEQTQEEIFRLIEEHTLAGRTVARLKGGDPIVFGRGAEEWALAQQHGVTVELIPGVTSAISVPSLAGIPLTYRKLSQSFAVITGHCHDSAPQEWRRYVHVDTLVILMGVQNRVFVASTLISVGRSASEPIAFIENGSTALERVVEATLADVASGHVDVHNPAVFVVGEVVRLRHALSALAQPAPNPEQAG